MTMDTRASDSASGATTLRDEIDRLVSASDGATAVARLRELWRAAPDSPTAAFVCSRWRQLDARQLLPSSFVTHRVALLRSFTVEPMCPLLEASAWHAGIRLQIHVGEFNAYVQELLDAGSALYRFDPQSVILALQGRDVAPGLWAGSESGDWQGTAREVVDRYRGWIDAFRRQSSAHIILHSFDRPDLPAEGILDAQDPEGQTAIVAEINRGLQQLARSYRGVYLLDYDGLIARHGRRSWHDARKWLAVRLPVAAPHLVTLVREWMKFLHPITGKLAKVCVVDLDNTLWGGVIGEDGLKGIQISQQDYRGAPYWNLQQALLELHGRGILLAIASKNNPGDVQEVFDGHDGMLLKDSHFAARQINWDDKALNLQRIAGELNVGVDSLAFVDDNPVERQRVREALPEVMVLDLPGDPMQFATAVRESPVFQRLEALGRRPPPLGAVPGRAPASGAAAVDRVGRGFPALARPGGRNRCCRFDDPRPCGAADAEDEPVQPDHTALHRAADRGHDSRSRLEGLHLPGQGSVCRQRPCRCGDHAHVRPRLRDRQLPHELPGHRAWGRDRSLERARGAGGEPGLPGDAGMVSPDAKNAPCRSFFAEHGFALVEEQATGSRWELDLESGARVPAPDWVTVDQTSRPRKD